MTEEKDFLAYCKRGREGRTKQEIHKTECKAFNIMSQVESTV
jgi:hypothetical protein